MHLIIAWVQFCSKFSCLQLMPFLFRNKQSGWWKKLQNVCDQICCFVINYKENGDGEWGWQTCRILSIVLQEKHGWYWILKRWRILIVLNITVSEEWFGSYSVQSVIPIALCFVDNKIFNHAVNLFEFLIGKNCWDCAILEKRMTQNDVSDSLLAQFSVDSSDRRGKHIHWANKKGQGKGPKEDLKDATTKL
jgi:hypothetical protein